MTNPHGPAGEPADDVPAKAKPDATNDAAGFTVTDGPPDPLDGLVDRAKDDPGLPFQRDVLAALRELRRKDRHAFETMRTRLKSVGVRVAQLDPMVAGDTSSLTTADLLIEIAGNAELFHTADMVAYADVIVERHRETWQVQSGGFRRWLKYEFYKRTRGAPSGDAVQAALGVIEAKAYYDAPERPIFLRVGEHAGNLYLDLCDHAWRAVEIDVTGWRVVTDPPCRFRRTAGMLPLLEPIHGGSIADLRRFLNIAGPADNPDDPPGFVLAAAWLLAAFRATGPYPLLILAGEQGSAKSTFLLILRMMIDPNISTSRSLPRDDRDLFIAANNGHVLSFDNVSRLPAAVSDTLCRLATGGGYATRQLYTDQDEVLFNVMRPCAMNGIDDVASRPDLADRSLFLTLSAIPEEKRRPQSELLVEIEAARPVILGALLNAVVHGLQKLPETRLDRLPRMADFALWATACEGGLGWERGTFMAAYDSNRRTAIADVIESDPVASAIRDLIDGYATTRDPNGRPRWRGTAKSLLSALELRAEETGKKRESWPNTPRALSGRVRRVATFLRASGIEISLDKREGHNRERIIEIVGAETGRQQSSAPSSEWNSSALPEYYASAGAVGSTTATVLPPIDRPQIVRSNTLQHNTADDADDGKPSQSGAGGVVVPPADRAIL